MIAVSPPKKNKKQTNKQTKISLRLLAQSCISAMTRQGLGFRFAGVWDHWRTSLDPMLEIKQQGFESRVWGLGFRGVGFRVIEYTLNYLALLCRRFLL